MMSTQLLFQYSVDHPRVGLAAAGLHHLADQEPDHLLLAAAILLHLLGSGGGHLINNLAEHPLIADGLQSFALHDRLGRITSLNHLWENFLGEFSADFALRNKVHQRSQVFLANGRFSIVLEERRDVSHYP